MNEYEADERKTLERLSQEWSAQGFEVLVQPGRNQVPAFLERYRPDAILIKDDDKVVVEVIRKGQPNAEQKAKNLRSLFSGQSEWRLEIVYAGEEVDAVKPVERTSILSTVAKVDSLIQTEPRASLLLFWAALEAAARLHFPSQTRRPQSPGRVIELLAGIGKVTPTEAKLLRNLMQLRNRVIHGELDAAIDTSELVKMSEIVAQLANQESG